MSISMELFPTLTSHVGSSARIGTGRIRSTNHGGISTYDSTKLRRMYGAMVITSRSDSGPTSENLFVGVKSESEFGLNMNNFFPTQKFSEDGIDDFHTLVSDLQSRALHDAVNEESDHAGNQSGANQILGVASEDGLKNCTNEKQVADDGRKNRGLRSEYHSVTHSSKPHLQVGSDV